MIETEAVLQHDIARRRDIRAADDVGHVIVEPGAGRQLGLRMQLVALAQNKIGGFAAAIDDCVFGAIGDARPGHQTIVAR
jgi:hypothetical protein